MREHARLIPLMSPTAVLECYHQFVDACIPEGAAMLESHRVKAHRLPEGHTSGRSHQTTVLSEYYRCPDLLQDLHQVRQSLVDTPSAQ